MKLHLPLPLCRALYAVFALAVFFPSALMAQAAETVTEYPNGTLHVTAEVRPDVGVLSGYELVSMELQYSSELCSSPVSFELCGGNKQVIIENGSINYSYSVGASPCGRLLEGMPIVNNETVIVRNNSIGGTIDGEDGWEDAWHENALNGVMYVCADMAIEGNGDVSFLGNSVTLYHSCDACCSASGGAIAVADGRLSITNNSAASFISNWVASSVGRGGAICSGPCLPSSGNGPSSVFISHNASVLFEGNSAGASNYGGSGGAIFSSGKELAIECNEEVIFRSNYADGWGGAIQNESEVECTISDNQYLLFQDNHAHYSGGALSAWRTVTLQKNRVVVFSGNSTDDNGNNDMGGGAVCGGLLLQDNGDVRFENNHSQCGAALYAMSEGIGLLQNESVKFLRNISSYGGWYNPYSNKMGGAVFVRYTSLDIIGNGLVRFDGNLCVAPLCPEAVDAGETPEFDNSGSPFRFAYAGALIGDGANITIAHNDDVVFRSNAIKDTSEWGSEATPLYRLRSLDVTGTSGVLNLSADAGHSITFYDSVYVEGTVNLNNDGKGDIVLTGSTIEEDLCSLKGGAATAGEIELSRCSEIAAMTNVYGGRFIVEDGVRLSGCGITAVDGGNATLRLKDADVNEGEYGVTMSAGSTLELEGHNAISASCVSLADGATLRFILDERENPVLTLGAELQTGQLQVVLSGDLSHNCQLISLENENLYDVSCWTEENVTVTGGSFDSLRWKNGVLTYMATTVITPGPDGAFDEGSLSEQDRVLIDGNGHTLTVKNEVQLVQMALKNGIVKLEGENNGIVSVTLTEGGELVLTAGAGLKTGDIISMVASGKGELHISGNITLDNKGMKGKAGELATLSHADMQVLGDASVSNVRVEDSVIDLAEGSTVTFSHVALAAGSRITDDPATLVLDNVTAELELGVNVAVVTTDDVLQAGSTLVQNGKEQVSFTLAQDAVVVQLASTTFDSVTLTGDSLVLQLSGVETEFFNGADYVAVSFTSGTGLATFGTDLEVLLTLDAEHVVHGYYVQGGDHTAMLFATNDKAEVTPEPATATLSLLALAALAARRKRK